MNDKMLVAYATRTRTTEEVARAIGEVLVENGATADVRNVKDVDDPPLYGAVVLGSAIRAGNLLPEAIKFVEQNQEALGQMPVAYFVVCATLQEDTEENRQVVSTYLSPLRQLVEPVKEGLFAGAIDRGKLSLPLRLMLKAMKADDGDWRDWHAIRAWAADVHSLLQGEGTVETDTQSDYGGNA
jgi:menaquinone-dependent protoporphyrinogen oxidase